MNEIKQFILNISLSDMSDIIGIIGFTLSIYTALSVRTIKNSYRKKFTLPAIKADLEQASSRLNSFFSNWETCNKSECQIELDAILKLSQKAGKLSSGDERSALKKDIRELQFLIKNQQQLTENTARAAHRIAHRVIREVDDSIDAQNWR